MVIQTRQNEHESWALLSHLRSFDPEPWLCIGDFNKVVEQSEKFGGVRKKESQMVNFRNVLADCGLSDLGFKGSKYTWANCQSDGNFIKERLDRAVANAALCDMHRSIEVRVLTTCTSDHKPIVLQLFGIAQARVSFKKSFKVEASWMHNEKYDEVVKGAWRGR
jgi:endonuclease/exonuclease/phosphatase family metal-dependent hydrolase